MQDWKKIGKAVEVVNNVGDTLEKGDHVGVHRSVYSHHGIYDGDGWVYEYNEGSIRINSLEDFADGSDIYGVDQERRANKNYKQLIK